jgi:hypothetical protein
MAPSPATVFAVRRANRTTDLAQPAASIVTENGRERGDGNHKPLIHNAVARLIRELRIGFRRRAGWPEKVSAYKRSSISKNSGQVLRTHAGSRIATPGMRRPASAKDMAMRWSS